MHIGTINRNGDYDIELKVGPGCPGPVALAIFWTALASSNPPDPIIEAVAPGASALHRVTVPGAALRLVIDLDMPDNGGHADLSVTERGGESFSRTLQQDARWTAVVA